MKKGFWNYALLIWIVLSVLYAISIPLGFSGPSFLGIDMMYLIATIILICIYLKGFKK